jgi:DnaJ-class molecular chaperone
MTTLTQKQVCQVCHDTGRIINPVLYTGTAEVHITCPACGGKKEISSNTERYILTTNSVRRGTKCKN